MLLPEYICSGFYTTPGRKKLVQDLPFALALSGFAIRIELWSFPSFSKLQEQFKQCRNSLFLEDVIHSLSNQWSTSFRNESPSTTSWLFFPWSRVCSHLPTLPLHLFTMFSLNACPGTDGEPGAVGAMVTNIELRPCSHTADIPSTKEELWKLKNRRAEIKTSMEGVIKLRKIPMNREKRRRDGRQES